MPESDETVTPLGTPSLAPQHARLIVASAISDEVAVARGYRTVTVKAELGRLGFADYQCSVPTLLVPVYNVRGELATYQSRPDRPRIKHGKALKYETPAGIQMVLDVPPRARSHLGNPGVPLFITEGVRKADSAVSAGLCCIALLGVFSWRGRNADGGLTALPDWEYIALNGRRIYIVFDSDVMEKLTVHAALTRLKALLESRAADVRVIYLPSGAGATKVGLDDFLAAGHSVDDLLALAVTEIRPLPRAEVPDNAVPTRPEIIISGRYMREISDDAISALLTSQLSNPVVFRRGTILVRLLRETGHDLLAQPVEVAPLRGMLDRAADFVRVDREGNVFASRPPLDVLQDILSLPHPPFSALRAISTVPLFLERGELVATSGYHTPSGIIFDLDSLGPLPPLPTLDQALLLILVDLFGDFPFVDEASRAHAAALLLQPFVRALFPGATPLYLIEAPARGTGKGLLTDVVARITLGRPAPVIAPTYDGDELEKRITSLLISGTSFILLDNVTSLRAAALAAALTAEIWEARLLGRSQMLRLKNDATWVATGNNVELSDELARRVIPIRLDAGCAAPEERNGFRHPLPGWAREHRGELVAACLAIIQHWVTTGMPLSTATLGRFEGWAGVMGGILECAGITGFLANRARLRAAADQETQEWTAFCAAWGEAVGTTPVTAGRLFALLREHELLLDLWAGRSQLSGQQRLGHAMAQRRDRVFGSYVIRDAGRDSLTRNAAYQLERISGPDEKHPKTPETPARESAPNDMRPIKTPDNGRQTPQNTPIETPARESGWGVPGVPGVLDPPHDEPWEEVIA